ncbi:GGDEF domain-containing protein [Sphingomonas sp. 7/4-4]|uniref:GGDEF domain-containing protein n=1 Tax=Sphingomonas sp. 7/4-4 TaxID=3018446 RepID=UPI00300DDFA7
MISKSGALHALVEALGIAPDASVAVRDALTGARDANSARRWIDRELVEGKPIGAILIALNRFETVNTAYGREAGDALLRGVSRRVAEVARELLGREAIVARIGGSEFLVASHDADATRLVEAEARLEEVLSRPFVAGGEIAHLGARMVSVTSVGGDSAGTLCGAPARRCSATQYRRSRMPRRSRNSPTICIARSSAARSACAISRRWRSPRGR